jgi:hypothetical protein
VWGRRAAARGSARGSLILLRARHKPLPPGPRTLSSYTRARRAPKKSMDCPGKASTRRSTSVRSTLSSCLGEGGVRGGRAGEGCCSGAARRVANSPRGWVRAGPAAAGVASGVQHQPRRARRRPRPPRMARAPQRPTPARRAAAGPRRRGGPGAGQVDDARQPCSPSAAAARGPHPRRPPNRTAPNPSPNPPRLQPPPQPAAPLLTWKMPMHTPTRSSRVGFQ